MRLDKKQSFGGDKLDEKIKENLKSFGWTVLKAVLTGLTVFCANIFGGN